MNFESTGLSVSIIFTNNHSDDQIFNVFFENHLNIPGKVK